MQISKSIRIASLLVLGAVAACATTPEEDTARADAQAQIDAEILARKGETVSRVCPRGSDGWKALGDDVLLLEAGDEWFMAELAGTCDPETAFAGIVTRSSPASSCIERGDDIFTGRPRSGGRCVITALYAWDVDADVAQPDPAVPAAQ